MVSSFSELKKKLLSVLEKEIPYRGTQDYFLSQIPVVVKKNSNNGYGNP